MSFRRVIVVGLDGLDPVLTEAMLSAGELPNLRRIRDSGGYARIKTTNPAQTPVAWSSFAVGTNPGGHGIFDFLRRDPATYLPEVGLYRHEQRNRFLPPQAVNLRGGVPVWERLSRAGIPSIVLRHPCTYPPASFRGRLLAGIGVPDLRGGFGSSTFFTPDGDADAGEGERVLQVRLNGQGEGTVHLPGPLEQDGSELRIPLDLRVDPEAGVVRISCPDGSFTTRLSVGEWSDWLRVRFRKGLLQRIRGLVRFHLSAVEPFRLFASPVHFDPDSPLYPISHPWDYAGELERAIGTYATLGLAEEHNGLTNGRIDERAFLAQATDIMEERRAMMHHELSRFDDGLFYCLFGTPDRIQHMFWRFREPDHPANGGVSPDEDMARVIETYYRRCDEVVGEALSYGGEDTLFLVLSDHGFTSFQRQVQVNSWLHREGYLALKPGVEAGDGAGDLLRNVDWSRTRAYALGMAGLYLNLRGREGEGIVSPEDALSLRRELAGGLSGLEDPGRGQVAVRTAIPRESIYSGSHTDDAPDILIGCAPGYRVGSDSAMGGIGSHLFSDNTRRWSGDHVVDPAAVPGVCFMSAPFHDAGPSLLDMAPTILKALGAPLDGDLEGDPLI